MALRDAKECGRTRSISLVAWRNTPALRVSRDRAGRAVVGSVGYWSTGLTRKYFLGGGVRLDMADLFHVPR